ncbi:hypothetical protein BBK14_26855 [Parafrankia soli]|uniref:Aminoglycoside phosphotransferase domain-containing protein n=1 Tax=Parafrankia soli TaxID=2599596 RepID=A0A1S1PJS6_9ACTN|nr:hypothetical protein BBK14_26855 [Parafrankia soli]
MHGRVPVSFPVYNATGWLTEATSAQRRRLWESAVGQLAAIHRVPVDDVRLVDRPQRGVDGLDQQVTYWRQFAAWALGDEVPPIIRTLLDWLVDHRPSRTVPGLAWGDARIGNMMFGPDYEVVGVMDWEQASLADPLTDLGWWLFFGDIHSTDHGVPRLDGLGGREETIDAWRELTGRTVHDLHWYEVFAGVKTGLLALRSQRSLRIPKAEGAARNMFLTRACRLAELTPPEESA